MANFDNNTMMPSSQQKAESVDADQAPAVPSQSGLGYVHHAFSWRLPEAKSTPHGDFIELARNVSRGAELCLQIVMVDAIDRNAEQPTLLNVSDLERLMLMTGAALRMLGDRAEEAIGAMNDAATRGAV